MTPTLKQIPSFVLGHYPTPVPIAPRIHLGSRPAVPQPLPCPGLQPPTLSFVSPMGSRATCVCGILGLLLSLYALYVEHQSAINPGYQAMCDTSWMSCTRVWLLPHPTLCLAEGDVPLARLTELCILIGIQCRFSRSAAVSSMPQQ